jgi:hypothetical protein
MEHCTCRRHHVAVSSIKNHHSGELVLTTKTSLPADRTRAYFPLKPAQNHSSLPTPTRLLPYDDEAARPLPLRHRTPGQSYIINVSKVALSTKDAVIMRPAKNRPLRLCAAREAASTAANLSSTMPPGLRFSTCTCST